MNFKKDCEDLLKECGYTVEDVNKAFLDKEKRLEKKKHALERHPLEGIRKLRVGRFVTLRQTDNPCKMFVLQELFYSGKEAQIRIGYYIVSKKMLREKRKLSLQWGQFNPNFPKGDLMKLIERAKRKGIL